MSRIPFIEARFFDPEETADVIGRRFAEHLRKLRSPTLPSSEQEDDAVNRESDEPYSILHTQVGEVLAFINEQQEVNPSKLRQVGAQRTRYEPTNRKTPGRRP